MIFVVASYFHNVDFFLLFNAVAVLLSVSLMRCLVFVVVQADDILTEKCHPSYYTRPKCLNHTDGYGCSCGPGFHWNTEMCMCKYYVILRHSVVPHVQCINVIL